MNRGGFLNKITGVPPTSRGAPCTLLSKVTGAQECDARDADSSTAAGNIKKQLFNYRFFFLCKPLNFLVVDIVYAINNK